MDAVQADEFEKELFLIQTGKTPLVDVVWDFLAVHGADGKPVTRDEAASTVQVSGRDTELAFAKLLEAAKAASGV